MRIVFFGTAEFGEPSLRALHESHEVVLVTTAPDAPKGRGLKLTPPPIKTAALECGLRVAQPEDLRDPAFIEMLKNTAADLYYVVAFRILPPEVFALPQRGTVNLHGSLLPDYRGAAPINWAVINGDESTGLTTFFINERVDTGDIILQETVSIGLNETAGELYDRMKVIGGELTVRTVSLIERGEAHPVPQPPGQRRPAPKLFRGDGLVDWSKDARTVHNHVRGMTPFPGAFTECAGGPMKIRRTCIVDTETPGDPGRIVACSTGEGLVVSCGRGSVRIEEIQPPGKKKITSGSFVCGHAVEADMHISNLC